MKAIFNMLLILCVLPQLANAEAKESTIADTHLIVCADNNRMELIRALKAKGAGKFTDNILSGLFNYYTENNTLLFQPDEQKRPSPSHCERDGSKVKCTWQTPQKGHLSRSSLNPVLFMDLASPVQKVYTTVGGCRPTVFFECDGGRGTIYSQEAIQAEVYIPEIDYTYGVTCSSWHK